MWTQGPEWTYVLWDQRAHSFLFAFKPTNEKLPYIYIIYIYLYREQKGMVPKDNFSKKTERNGNPPDSTDDIGQVSSNLYIYTYMYIIYIHHILYRYYIYDIYIYIYIYIYISGPLEAGP